MNNEFFDITDFIRMNDHSRIPDFWLRPLILYMLNTDFVATCVVVCERVRVCVCVCVCSQEYLMKRI